MADKFSTTPHNFDKVEENISPTKYLDLAGLITFFDKLKDYISTSDKNLNGSNIKLYPGKPGEDNPTISSQIENLWAALGEGEIEGGIAGNVTAILGQYVKDIKHAETQGLPLKVKVVEGDANTNQKDIYTISLEDNGLNDDLEDVKNNRVSSIDTADDGGSVTISVDKNKGDVTLTVNSLTLTEEVNSLKTGKIASVTEGESSETYVDLGVSTSNNAVTITIDDSKLVDELDDIKNTYALKTEIPTHLPSLHPIKLKDTGGVEHVFNGSKEVDLTAGVNYAANSGKLGGQEPSHYAKQSDLNATNERIGDIEGSYAKTVSVDTNGTYTQLTVTPTKGDVKISVDDSEVGVIDERLGDVESSYVKTFGNKKGDITINSGSTTPWDVNFTMDNNTLKGTVVEPTHLGVEDINVSSSLDGVVTISETQTGGMSAITIGGSLKNDLIDINNTLKNRVQSVGAQNSNTGTQYVTISVNADTDNDTSNGKQSLITINDSSLSDAIDDIKGAITALGTVVVFKGYLEALPEPGPDSIYNDGDFVIVGDKEYIYYQDKWYLLGSVGDFGSVFNQHKHQYTPAGTIESDFVGTQATITTGGASDTVDVSKLKTTGSVPTYLGIPVPNTLHTHSVTHTPEGTIESRFTGTSDTVASTGPSGFTTVAVAPTISYKAAVLTITFGTTTVASNAHTHKVSYTPAGTVTSEFEGTTATLTSARPDINSVTTINSITSAGSMPTFDSVEVASNTHTHSATYKPAGTVTSTFAGTPGETSVPMDIYEIPDDIVTEES